jgi:hypothetical protein
MSETGDLETTDLERVWFKWFERPTRSEISDLETQRVIREAAIKQAIALERIADALEKIIDRYGKQPGSRPYIREKVAP